MFRGDPRLNVAPIISAAAAAFLALGPDWAFPTGAPSASQPQWDSTQRISRPGSDQTYTEAMIHDGGLAVDWRPAEHSAMPAIVARSSKPGGFACGYCHLPAGEGRPENASLAGLPPDYIVRQVEALKSGKRTNLRPDWVPARLMAGIAKTVDPEDLRAAAAYFSRQTFTSHVRVVESAATPRPTPAAFVYVVSGADWTPLGQRIIETPADFKAFEQRDGHVAYTAFVPVGAIRRGRALAGTGGPNAQSCTLCHGLGLRGAASGPPIAGRSPSYIFRQLAAFRAKSRREPEALVMQGVTAKLTDAEMIDLAAYAAALKP